MKISTIVRESGLRPRRSLRHGHIKVAGIFVVKWIFWLRAPSGERLIACFMAHDELELWRVPVKQESSEISNRYGTE